MGWLDYYRLLEKYHGDLSQATKEEMRAAVAANPNNAADALALAWKEFQRGKRESAPHDHCCH